MISHGSKLSGSAIFPFCFTLAKRLFQGFDLNSPALESPASSSPSSSSSSTESFLLFSLSFSFAMGCSVPRGNET